MCKICVEYQLGNLTWDEAMKNSYEITDKDHMQDVLVMLVNDLFPEGTD